MGNFDTTKELLSKIVIPYTEKINKEMKLPDSQKTIIVWDTFKGQNNDEVRDLLEKHGMAEVVIPANTTAFNQPLDVSVNRPCKHFMREMFKGWYAAEVEKKINAGESTSDIAIGMHGHSSYARAYVAMAGRFLYWVTQYILRETIYWYG